MTILEKFAAFAERLPAARRDEVEGALAALMDSYDRESDFTSDELAELDRRVAEPRPQFADGKTINDLLQRQRRD